MLDIFVIWSQWTVLSEHHIELAHIAIVLAFYSENLSSFCEECMD